MVHTHLYGLTPRLLQLDCLNPKRNIFAYLPKVQPLHVSTCSSLPLGSPVEICYMILKAPWCKWPNLLCHGLPISWPCTNSALEFNEARSSASILQRLFTQIPILLVCPVPMCLRNSFPLLKTTSKPLSNNIATNTRFLFSPVTYFTSVMVRGAPCSL